jgi:hypothetical protein
MPIRPELVRKYVMASMADDYESLELIVGSVSTLAKWMVFPRLTNKRFRLKFSD